MKCQNCNNKLYFISSTKVLCKTCDKELNPLDIKYKCIVCKNNFSSEAKVFNPLEYKALKICIKENFIFFYKQSSNILNKLYMVTPCKHIFHSECLEKWLEHKKECPNCRTSLENLV